MNRLGAEVAALVSSLGLLGVPAGGIAQTPEGNAVLQARALTPEEAGAFRLDGLLSEAFWIGAPALSGLVQQEPAEGRPASEATFVYVLYDHENLYVGIRALDSEPEQVVSRILQRDRVMVKDPFTLKPAFAGDDGVAILLDPFDDNRNGYLFATNANGAEFDALLADEGKEFNLDWRGVWEVAGTRTEEGWSAEMRIPLRTLRYPAGEDRAWGLNVFRMIRRKNEKALWQGWARGEGGIHRVSLAGSLAGLHDLPPPSRNLEVKPYVLGGRRQSREDNGSLDRTNEAEVGLDLKTELRPGLVLDVTLNTDFAQVEVDDEQVNLTRFGLFFPEKRDFFLENSGIFDFGFPGSPFEPPAFQMFFSRRIGIEEDEEKLVPMLGGARLTGRVGAQTVGFLTAVTDEVEDLVPRETFSVARLKRDVGENHYVGFMATDRRRSGAGNTLVGADAAFYLTSALNVQGWAARSFTSGEWGEEEGDPTGDDLALGVAADLTADRWGGFLRYVQVGKNMTARSGFIQREDLRRVDTYGRRRIRPGLWGIRLSDLYLGANVFTAVDGTLQDYAVGPFWVTEWESGDQVTLAIQKGEARPDEEFDVADTLPVPPGEYDASYAMVFLNTSPARPASLNGSLQVSEFYGGTLRAASATLTLAPSPQISVGLGFNRNRVEVPSGDFTADLVSVRAGYAFSTRLTANLLVQYNTLDQYFSTNLRVNFIHRPGSDLFLVFTEEREEDASRWRLSDRGMVMKVTYLRRF